MADQKRRTSAAQQPITGHPMFPAIVALWFGALFGLTSLVIRTELIEGLVTAGGIDRVIPMAAPPLGGTMRILLAMMLTALGAGVGFLLARRLARESAPAVGRIRERPSAAAPLHDEPDDFDDDQEHAGFVPFGAREAGLAVDHDADELPPSGPAGRLRRYIADETDEAQAAGEQARSQILSIAEFDLDGFEPSPGKLPAQAEEAEVAEDAWLDSDNDGRDWSDAGMHDADADAGEYVRAFREPVAAAPARMPGEVPKPGFASLPRFDLSGAMVPPQPEAEPAEPEFTATLPPAPRPEPETAEVTSASALEPSVEQATAAERIASAPLDALSHVELLERLALTIERRRVAAREAAEAHARMEAEAAAAAAQTAAPQAPSPQAVAPEAFERPAALRPVAFDEVGDETVAPGYVPPRHMAAPRFDPARNAADDEADILATGYSSLLNLSRPASSGPETAKVGTLRPAPHPQTGTLAATLHPFEAPRPVEPRVSEDTEKALRAALATLQRMSGAA